MENSVLVVDEDVNARIIAETLLRVRGLHVLTANNGTEACDVVRCEGAAVVILGLPDCTMGSLQLLRILRGQLESFPVPTPRILVLAGRRGADAERAAFRSSADVFLRKPAEPAQFIHAVEQLIDMNGSAQSKSEQALAVIGFAAEEGALSLAADSD